MSLHIGMSPVNLSLWGFSYSTLIEKQLQHCRARYPTALVALYLTGE